MKSLFFSVCFTVILFNVSAKSIDLDYSTEVELPEGAVPCPINSDDRDTCIKNSIQDMIPKLQKGFSSLNIPAYDPFVLNTTHFNYKRGPFNLAIQLKSATAYGASKTQIKDVRTKITENGMDTEIDHYYPRIVVEGTYKSQGRYNNLKINSKGYFNLTASDITSTTKTSGQFELKNGEKYLRINNFDMDYTIGDLKLYATGMFPDAELNKIALDFANQYWPFVYREMLPETKDIWEPMVLERMNNFLQKVPFHKMLYYAN